MNIRITASHPGRRLATRSLSASPAASPAMATKTALFAVVLLFATGGVVSQAMAGEGGRGERMAKLDTNGDGAIDRNEAAAFPKLAENFDRLDKNKDGRIDASERPQHRGRGGEGGKRGERMARLDSNGDGRFSREELAGHERALQNFTAIDTNNDGFLTREEMRAYHQKNGGRQRAPK